MNAIIKLNHIAIITYTLTVRYFLFCSTGAIDEGIGSGISGDGDIVAPL